jgi:myosin heavy subunit
MVLQQLQYTGMLETIRIRREGFAVRMPFEDVIGAYRGAVFEFHKVLHPTRQNVQKLLEACEAKQQQLSEARGTVSRA